MYTKHDSTLKIAAQNVHKVTNLALNMRDAERCFRDATKQGCKCEAVS